MSSLSIFTTNTNLFVHNAIMLINHHIYGSYSGVDHSHGLIIFVHGLTSSQDEDIFVYGEKYFNDYGYDTFRFNLYGDLPEEKKLATTTLQDNIEGITTVINYFVQQGKENIIVIGHSFGGLALLYSDLSQVSQLFLRDSSIGGSGLLSDVYHDEHGYYIDRGDGFQFRISDNLYADFCIDPSVHLQQIKTLQLSTTIIAAEYGLQDPAQQYADVLGQQVHIIIGADHIFSDDQWKKELLDYTFDQFVD